MHILGLHFEKNILKVALLLREKKKLTIELLRTFDSDCNVKPLYTLAPILSGKRLKLVTGLEAWEILLRQFTLKLSNHRALLKALPFQLESLIPFPPSEGIFVPFFQKIDRHSTKITLFAAKCSQLEKHLEDLKTFDIHPDQISSTSFALYRFARFIFPEHTNLLIFHFGEEKSSFLSILDRKLVLSQSLSIGKNHFFEAANEEKMREPLVSQFQKELRRMSTFLSQKFLTREILLTGDFPWNTESLIKEALDFSFLTPTLDQYDFATLQSYAIPIGLSLEKETGLQFRQGAYKARGEVKKEKRALYSYLISCIALTLMLWVGSSLWLKQKEAALLSRFNVITNKHFEDNLAQALEEFNKTLQKQKTPSTYFLTVPRVSDLLAWISTHPKLETIEMQKVHYLLTKFPQIGSEKESYEAKVELEFTADSPRLAREFHDALLAGDELVNSKLPITWSTSNETYSTSFFLNRKVGS